ncbi:MAG: type VI secretion system baseplate subunit TssF [Reinekea sp.]|nr:type VI secretion system baseplate subunit TssF [Reinekea sp.]
MLSYREYFEAEMRSLQDLAQEFADAYPEQAAMLNLNAVKDRDPYVERLLEGMAFLTSQIRHRLDDSVPEISERLLDQIMPTMVRPYPANTIVQFTPNIQNKEPVQVDAGRVVKSLNSGPLNANCSFTTTHPVKVQPFALQQVSCHEKAGGGSTIRLTFQKSMQASWSDIDLSQVKIYLSADWMLAYSLFHVFTDHETHFRAEIDGRGQLHSPLPIRCMGAHQRAGDHLLPMHGRARSAFAIMHDYFCAREKYLFVELSGLDQLNIPETSQQFSVQLDARVSLPVDTQLTTANLRLFCAPAVNLFKDDAEPIIVDHSKSEYRVSADRQISEYSSIYSVGQVNSRDQSSGETHFYSPLHAMRHRKQDDRVFATSQRTAGVDKRLTYISLNSPPPFNSEIVSIEALFCNDQYPRRYIEVGGIHRIDEDISRVVEAKNLTRPSKMYQRPDFQDFQWQLISLLSLNLSSLESVDNLQHMLMLFDWTDLPENQRKIEAIAGIRTKTTHRLRRGVLFQGLEIRIELNESGYSSVADMYLFGSVLHQFFSAFANMTEFVQTRVVQLPSYKEWTWSPVFGNKALF